jgi:NAD(P)-dependent dehydrogenase (short-subunit alcohol dehydrogenase family)
MKVSVITGSGSGMGAAIAARLAGAGHRIIGIDIRNADIVADLSNSEGRARAIDEVTRRCDGRVDHLVCCAGLGPSADAQLIASVNYFGAIELLDGLLPLLSHGLDPSAVVVGSNEATLWSWDENPMPRSYLEEAEDQVHHRLRQSPIEKASHLAYASSKQAVTMATRQRAAEWGSKGVRLNVVAPGPVQTPLLRACEDDPRFSAAVKNFVAPIGRRAEPDEIASVVTFLLSGAASYVHGSVVFADGGIDATFRPQRF